MSLCPHGYTAFWDCPSCPPPMGEGRLPGEEEAWEEFNWHIGHCKGCIKFNETGILCNEGIELDDAWRRARDRAERGIA